METQGKTYQRPRHTTERFSVCPYCGGSMEGDGYTRVLHCEFADVPFDAEPDGPPVFCAAREAQG
jgi:hypothetical protein